MAKDNKNTAKETPVENKAAEKKTNTATELMKKLGVDILYENSRGEYFTSENYALGSEKGDKGKVITHKL